MSAPAPNAPHVQVFHFTSRISSAKIRKYKLATERGMAGGTARKPAPATGRRRPSPSSAPPAQDSSTTMEPPSKKPKLKLNVRPQGQESSHQSQSQSPDTIAVSRPRPDSSLKIRYSENMTVDDFNTDVASRQPKPSPAASSDLSSLSSLPPPEKQQIHAKDPSPASQKSRDIGRDFMSYYVDGGDDDVIEQSEPPPPPPKVAPPKAEPPKQAYVIQAPPLPPQETRFKHHYVPSPYPPAKAQPPRAPAPPPMPQVNLIDTIKPAKGPREPDTVANMIKKLEKLSHTLTEFGGVPSVPKSPKAASQDNPDMQPKPRPRSAPKKRDSDVDNFLAMFDDDDGDDNVSPGGSNSDIDSSLNFKLPGTGEADGPLKYGIHFIQNALRSWAYQRVTSQVAQQYQQMQMQARAESHPQKRGPGRPRKFDTGDEQSSFPQTPPMYQFDLAKTPEGAAIIAFQEVLDCGCLQLNSSLPIELTRALRHLYMQIDHLINQGSRNEPQWRCMSYGAQITAHRIRVEKWKEQQARAQEEMARQQQLAQQQVMQQMGLPTHMPRVPMTAEQAQHAHAMELERRRDLQHAAQQPHLTKYITNPMSMESSSTTSTTTSGPSNATVNGTTAKTSTATPVSAPASAPASKPAMPAPSSPSDPNNVHLDRIKLYMPNFLPRSGQSMKFSFAPNSALAVKAFGAEAFPTADNTPSNIPNRGPMNIISSRSPTTASNSPRPAMNGPASVLGSNAPPPTLQLKRSNSDTIEVAVKPTSRRETQGQGNQDKYMTEFQSGPATAKTNTSNRGSFTAINASKPPCRSNSMSSGSPSAMAAPKIGNNGNANGKALEMASRFPHPGAVVLDQ